MAKLASLPQSCATCAYKSVKEQLFFFHIVLKRMVAEKQKRI